MKKCETCGHKIKKLDLKYCPKCRFKVEVVFLEMDNKKTISQNDLMAEIFEVEKDDNLKDYEKIQKMDHNGLNSYIDQLERELIREINLKKRISKLNLIDECGRLMLKKNSNDVNKNMIFRYRR